MSRSLLFLRHAKSSWKDADLEDHDRPLNRRGRRDAPRVGRLLREQGLLPEVVLCSTATRARHTVELALAAAEWSCELHFHPALYAAPPDGILAVVRELPARVGRALVVGHNPGLEELVRELTGEEVLLPTAALCRLECDCETWSVLGPGRRVTLARLWKPSELEDRA
jgi:phosphohistidine phosphatase